MNNILKKTFSVAFSVIFMNFASFPAYCSGSVKKIIQGKKPYKAEQFANIGYGFLTPKFVQHLEIPNYSLISQNMYEVFLREQIVNKPKALDDTFWVGSELGDGPFKMKDLDSFGVNFKRIVFESGSCGINSFRNILQDLKINGEENNWKKEIYPLILESRQALIQDGFKLVITNNNDGRQIIFYFKFESIVTNRGKADYDFKADIRRYNRYIGIVSSLKPENPLKIELKMKSLNDIRFAIVPLGAKSIKKKSFFGLEHLEIVDIPNSIFSVGEDSFNGCIYLKKVNFNGRVLSIDKSAFEGCCNLREIELPDGLQYIGNFAFQSCEHLERITIPLTTEIIYFNAFRNTPNNLKILYGSRMYSKEGFMKDFISNGGLIINEDLFGF